jgi:hypothetical protein
MDVVPAFVIIDGARFPLAANERGVRIADDKRFPGLNALSYVAGHLVGMRSGAERVAELTDRKNFIRPQALVASVVNDDNRNDLGDGVDNWTRLAGRPPDLEDAYVVSTLFLDDMLVMPRHTLIRLIEQVGALHDAVLAHQLEPRTAQVDPEELAPLTVDPAQHPGDDDAVTDEASEDEAAEDEAAEDEAAEDEAAEDEPQEGLPRRGAATELAEDVAATQAMPAPNQIAADDVLRDIETLAAQVDALDVAARQGERLYADVERSAAAAARRHRLFLELEVAGLLEPALAGEARAALSRLGLALTLGYHDAARAMARYLASPERAARFPGEPVPTVTAARVSLDWFRTSSGYCPDGVTAFEWLALCEKNFMRPLPSSSAGERFVRLCGAMHQLLYRAEVGPSPCLWRALRAA